MVGMPDSLLKGLEQRMDSLKKPRKRISTTEDALKYFRKATLRKERIFVSYSGRDQDKANELIASFRKQFQDIFDYRDGKSIRPGEPWLKEIFDTLAVSPVGVPLLSPSYFESGNCSHELREMVARRDNGQMRVFPIKLRKDDEINLPNELKDLQYARMWEYKTPDDVASWIAANILR